MIAETRPGIITSIQLERDMSLPPRQMIIMQMLEMGRRVHSKAVSSQVAGRLQAEAEYVLLDPVAASR